MNADDPKNNKPIKVSIIDDDVLYRKTLKKFLSQDSRIKLYGEYQSGLEISNIINSPFQPDVCLVDIVLPDISGVECARKIKAHNKDVHIILMTSYPDPESLAQAKEIGADYIEKGTLGEVLIDKIVANINPNQHGQLVSLHDSPEVNSDKIILLSKKLTYAQKKVKDLSEHQRKALILKREGKSREEMASIMGISQTSVRTHLARAMKKLDLPDLLDYLNLLSK